MSIPTSILADLLGILPQLKPQMCFKASLTALSHAMEDQVLAGEDNPLVVANFQQERFYRQESHRYRRIAERTDQVYVLAAPETNFGQEDHPYATVPFSPGDPLSQEWHLVVIGHQYTSCLIFRERAPAGNQDWPGTLQVMEQTRHFEGIWTFDPMVSRVAASLLLRCILAYRPQLLTQVNQAHQDYNLPAEPSTLVPQPIPEQFTGSNPFVERLVNYLQAGQYKLSRAYRAIAVQERKERLVNSITGAIRRSLHLEEILKVAVTELGQSLQACRCLIYRCRATDSQVTLQFEFLGAAVASLVDQVWPLQENPLFQIAMRKQEPVLVRDTHGEPHLAQPPMQTLVNHWQINAWLLVPVFYQGRLLGMVEFHHCGACPAPWQEDVLSLVEAIATQIGIALIQAEAYSNLEDLNQQLAALDRTRSNLIAITGHELRTPLSTIQICLESLAMEPDMSPEPRQIMLNSALADVERLGSLVADFLKLSQLESGRVNWQFEPLSLQECVELSLSGLQARLRGEDLPQINLAVDPNLPLIWADGDWLVEVLAKLLDNACKFTQPEGEISIQAETNGDSMLKVTVADTGRGIEPQRLETVFDRFYQEENALRRSKGGTGLGLAMCRQIIRALGGQIWAESGGKGQGSAFHFTLPMLTTPKVPDRAGSKGV